MTASPDTPTAILAPDAELAPGYRVLALLSRNNALDVYDVWSEQRDARCIAKLVRPDRADVKRVQQRLRTEGELLLGFTHPNVVRAYELIEDPQLSLILETLSGVTLEALIHTARRRMPAAGLAHLAAQLASALSYVHAHGTVHLDVKPSNVIAQFGQAKLIDFSLARPPGPVPAGVGTRQYLAPEQARGGHANDRTDVWGLGMTLFETATGELPFAFDATAAAYTQLIDRAVPVRRLRRLAGPLADVIDACLDPDPHQRPRLSDVLAVAHSLVDVTPSVTVCE